MDVKHAFIAFCRTSLRPAFCIALYCLLCHSRTHAQDSLHKDEKHIYDSSERFFNRKAYADEQYFSTALKKNTAAQRELAELKKDKDFWYVDAIEKLQEKKVKYRQLFDSLARSNESVTDEQLMDERGSFADNAAVRMLLWILIIGILLFALIYFLSANKLSLFSKRDLISQASNEEEGPGVNIFESRFDQMFSKAAAEKNFRLMTRILYLQTLRILSDKNMIRYNPSYTNLEYLHQMHPTDHYLDFFTITRHYEYVWYGQFDLDEPVFRQIENAIRSFQKRIA